ncbi:hypothetical protein HDU96_010620 [Phlyctochytrium bullatum]|nr:hypothetical protein HDU96_010620 [Phlyctochytrium bullatum]
MRHHSQYQILHAALDSHPEFACEMVELLIESKAEVNVTDSKKGRTALHHALQLRNDYAATMLLKDGADPNIIDNNGLSAFHIWVQQSFRQKEYGFDDYDTTVLRQMLEKGMDLSAID